RKGTFLGGARVSRAQVAPRQTVQFGELDFVVERGESVSTTYVRLSGLRQLLCLEVLFVAVAIAAVAVILMARARRPPAQTAQSIKAEQSKLEFAEMLERPRLAISHRDWKRAVEEVQKAL